MTHPTNNGPYFSHEPMKEFVGTAAELMARRVTHEAVQFSDEQLAAVFWSVSHAYYKNIQSKKSSPGDTEQLALGREFLSVRDGAEFGLSIYFHYINEYSSDGDIDTALRLMTDASAPAHEDPWPDDLGHDFNQEEDLIVDLETDLDLRDADYEAGKDILERLFVRLQNSALGRKFRITGEVDSPEYCRTFDGFISCNIEVQLRPGHTLDLTLAIRPTSTGWTVQRYELEDDETVTIRHEDELIALTHDLLRHVSKQTTAQFAGDQ